MCPAGGSSGAAVSRSVSFRCAGHPNITATHGKTLEFTREASISPRASCILGVAADFDPEALHGFQGPVDVVIEVGGQQATVSALASPSFRSADRVVIRRSRHRSATTFAVGADKVASQIDRRLVAELARPDAVVLVTITARAKPSRAEPDDTAVELSERRFDQLIVALLDEGVSSRTIARAVGSLPGYSYRHSYERVLRLKAARERG